MSDDTKAQRVARATFALTSFAAQSGHDNIYDVAVTDLIADMGHYCDAHGIAFLHALERGIAHWSAETRSDEDNSISDMPVVSIDVDGGAS